MKPPLATLKKLGNLLKDAWLIVGFAILLLCFLEGCVSSALFIRDWFRPDQTIINYRVVADAYSDRSWLTKYYEELPHANGFQWKSYVYWRRGPFRGDHINIDPDGIRLTTLAAPQQQGSHAPVKIFMFGGSTLWGTGVRDAFTIPSNLARELLNAGVAADIVNFGESGYVSTQEVITLLLYLQKGHIPDLVVFYDGVNDTFSAYQQHVAGLPQNEFNRVKEFNLSKPGEFWRLRGPILEDVATKLSTVRLLKGLLWRFNLGDAALGAEPLLPGNEPRAGDSLAREVFNTYLGNIELVKALGAHYGFQHLFYWQPTIFRKEHLTAYENAQRDKIRPSAQLFEATYDVIHRSQLTKTSDYHFHDLARVFSDTREAVYIDSFHISEWGNAIIAKRMAIDVLALITDRKRAAARDSGPEQGSASSHSRSGCSVAAAH